MGIVKGAADLVYTFRFIRMLVLKWESWDAYKQGLIDEKGKRIKSVKNFYFSKKLPLKFTSQNLWKIFYFNGKEGLNDILNYKIFTSKKFDNS